MNRKTGVIFDLDGTILNTLDDLYDNVNYALAKFDYPKRSLEEVRTFVGNGIRVLVEKAVPSGLKIEEVDKVYQLFLEHYSANLENKTAPYPNIIELLEKLNNEKVIMGIVSNKFHEGVVELNNKFFSKYINVAIGNQEGLRPKPYPDLVHIALNELKLNNDVDNIFYIGDSEVDILTAKNAGLRVISVTWGFRLKDELKQYEPNFMVDSPFEILDIINK
jgi:phosphoglycolate phosphatase